MHVYQLSNPSNGHQGDMLYYNYSLCSPGIDPPDAGKEKDGITALQLMELKVDHSVSQDSNLKWFYITKR